jgi:RNA polymerase sigma factor (sigma-70 family)
LSATKCDDYMERLAKRMMALDEQAYKEFADIFGPRFKAFLLSKRVGISEAEDLAVSCITDVARKVAKGKYRCTKGGKFETWVFKVAHNGLLDWFRKGKGKRQAEVPLVGDVPAQNPVREESQASRDVMCAVHEALAQLSEGDRVIIELRDLGVELSYSEIGQRLRTRPATARVRHFRALKRLESILARDLRVRNLINRKRTANRGKSNERGKTQPRI